MGTVHSFNYNAPFKFFLFLLLITPVAINLPFFYSLYLHNKWWFVALKMIMANGKHKLFLEEKLSSEKLFYALYVFRILPSHADLYALYSFLFLLFMRDVMSLSIDHTFKLARALNSEHEHVIKSRKQH